MEGKQPRRKRRVSVFWPLLLITIGIVLLLENLDILGPEGWDLIWRMWPALFIIIGLDSILQRSGVAGPVILIGLGTVFLLSNLNLLAWDAWKVLSRLWPLLLIAIGLDIIISRRSTWISLAGVILTLVIFAGALWLVGVGTLEGDILRSEEIHQPLGDARQAEITIAPAFGNIQIDTFNTKSDDLVSGEVLSDEFGHVWTDYSMRGDTAVYSVKSRMGVVSPGSQAWKWMLSITPDIPVDLDASMGAGAINLDLDDLQVSNLEVSQGVGKIKLILPPEGQYGVDVNQAIGKIEVVIPAGMGVRLEVSRAISSLTRPAILENQGDYYISSNYDTAEDKVDIEVSQAIGNIAIRFEH